MSREEKMIAAKIIFDLREYLKNCEDVEIFRAHNYLE